MHGLPKQMFGSMEIRANSSSRFTIRPPYWSNLPPIVAKGQLSLAVFRLGSLRLHVVAQRLQQGPLVAARRRELDQRLEEPPEEFLPPQAVVVQEFLHLEDVSRAPQVHQLVDAVDERHGQAAVNLVAYALVFALSPALELYTAPLRAWTPSGASGEDK